VHVPHQRRQIVGHVDDQRLFALLQRRLDIDNPALQQLADIDRFVAQADPTLDVRQVQHVVDQLLHPVGALDADLDHFALQVVHVAQIALQHRQRAQRDTERIAQIVRRRVNEVDPRLLGFVQVRHVADDDHPAFLFTLGARRWQQKDGGHDNRQEPPVFKRHLIDGIGLSADQRVMESLA